MVLALIGWSALTGLHQPATAATTPAPAAASSTQASLSSPLNREEAQKLLNILNNPQERERFTQTLSLMARGMPASPSTPTAAATAQLKQNLLPDLHQGFSSLRMKTWQGVRDFFSLFHDLRYVGYETHSQLVSPTQRHAIFSTVAQIGAVFVIALLLERAISLGLRRPTRHWTGRAHQREDKLPSPEEIPPSDGAEGDDKEALRAVDERRQVETIRFLARIPYAIGFLALKLLPVVGFYGLAWLASACLPWSDTGSSVLIIVTNAYAVTRCAYLGKTILAPHAPAIRLLPVMDSTAHLLSRWWAYLVTPPALLFVVANIGDLHFIILPRGADAIIRTIVLAEHILIALFIWRVRYIVSAFLTPTRAGQTLSIWNILAAAVHMWWVPALFLDISLWVVWALQLPGGYRWILLTTAYTVGSLVGFRIVAILAYGLQNTLFRLSPAMVERFPGLQERADRYYSLTRTVLTSALMILTAVCIAELWGLPSFGFFLYNPLGEHLLATIIILLAAVMTAILIWEGMNLFLARQLSHFETMGLTSRATRLKTVLPIIRTVMLALIIIIVTVTTLSQMGINVTPLLTGAGIMGAAIAFGSQSLVKDFITGFFMLVEDAIQVGDWVTAGGVSGTVENLSIRTVRIRDTPGDLHIIPFSSVTSVTNTARGYNKVVIKQQLDLSEDFDRVVAIMAGVIAEMREDKVFGPMILSDYTDLGVDDSNSAGATLVGSIMTVPMMKWKVKREFNRRVANRFAQAKVKFYTGTSYITTPPGGPFQISREVANDVANDVDAPPPSDPSKS